MPDLLFNIYFLPPGPPGPPWDPLGYPRDPRGPQGKCLEVEKIEKKHVWVIFLFFAYKSILSQIVVGFELKFECAVKKARNLSDVQVKRLD